MHESHANQSVKYDESVRLEASGEVALDYRIEENSSEVGTCDPGGLSLRMIQKCL